MTREQIHIGDMSHETAIGILKLMLEAMETYDGISPTPERINAVKMAIESLTMSSVTPQEPFINKPCVSSGVCEHDKNKTLDKLRAEIETKYGQCDICEYFEDYDYEENDISEYRPIGDIADILQIIDKYKGESEDNE